MVLVGLTGYKRSGKDTFAEVLIKEGGFVRLAFADALKQEVADFLGIRMSTLEEEKTALRRTLQLRGTLRRSVNENCWVEIVERRIAAQVNTKMRIVVTDVRYPNEAAMLRKYGAYIMRMKRTDQSDVTTDTHPSETNVDLIEPDDVIQCSSIVQRQAEARDFLRRAEEVERGIRR